MGRQLRNLDDESIRNLFDLPVICDSTEPTQPCCDPCTDLLFCLRRSFYELTLAGFDFENWLADHWMTAATMYKSEQGPLSFTGGGTFAFAGVFLAEPPSPQGTAVPCPFPSRADECDHTHRVRAERTLSAVTVVDGQPLRFGINVNTDCFVVEDVKYVQFTVNLVWQSEQGDAVVEDAFDPQAGDPPSSIYCPPKAATPYDPDSGETSWSCCPILISDLIPTDSIASLADLADVTLHELPPATATFDPFYDVYQYDVASPSQLCLQTTGTWVCCLGLLLIRCSNGEPECVYVTPINDCSATIDGVAANLDPLQDPPTTGEILGCSSVVYSGGCNAPGSGTCEASYCISRPIEYVPAGVYKLKVIDRKCRTPEGCGTCVPDPEKPHVAVPVAFSFTATPAVGCVKTFTPVITACVNIVNVYWSWGAVSEGLDPVTHEIVNLDPDGVTERKEPIAAIAIDDRGCIYCYSADVTCGCCEGGASGDLSVEPLEDGCGVELCASVTSSADPDCEDLAFIEVQYLSGGCTNYDDNCPCLPLQPGEEGDPTACFPCSFTMVDGECREIESVWSELRWRVWDRVCGCPGPWTYIENNPCAELGLIGGAPSLLTDNNVGLGQCYDDFPTCICDCYEEDFTWSAAWPAWFCGERVRLRWEHDTSGEEAGTIVNPGDPIEDQIAEYEIFEPGVLRGLDGHIMKMWLVTDSFTCPVYCNPIPECGCYPPNADFYAESCEECEEFAVGPAC